MAIWISRSFNYNYLCIKFYHYVVLRNMPMNEDIFEEIIRNIEQNTTTSLSVGTNPMPFTMAFFHKKFVDGGKFESKQMMRFAHALQKNSSITELSFIRLLMEPEAVSYLGKALMYNEKLDKLSFEWCFLNNSSIIEIAKALSANTHNNSYSLTLIFDGLMMINEEVAMVLAKLIIDKKLYHLDIYPLHNISSGVAAILVQAADKNPRMKVVRIDHIREIADVSWQPNKPKNKAW